MKRLETITVPLAAFFLIACVYFCKAQSLTANFTLRPIEKFGREELYDLPNNTFAMRGSD